jgi:glycosyltransferase involved in cell wall biosynthesis
VSCYADHVLDDYELKLVPLHLASSQLVVATSKTIKNELLALAPGLDAHGVMVKANAIDTGSFPVSRPVEPAPQDAFRLVAVSRLAPKKGLHHLIAALEHVDGGGLDVVLYLLGGVDESAEDEGYARGLRDEVAARGLESRVVFCGRCSAERVRQELSQAHLFVAPAVVTAEGDKDGIPTALLEAMSTGLAAVASDAGSIPEVIVHGENGWMVPQGDTSALALALEKLLRDPDLRHRLGGKAAETVRASFDVAACEPLLHSRLEDVLSSRWGSPGSWHPRP